MTFPDKSCFWTSVCGLSAMMPLVRHHLHFYLWVLGWGATGFITFRYLGRFLSLRYKSCRLAMMFPNFPATQAPQAFWGLEAPKYSMIIIICILTNYFAATRAPRAFWGTAPNFSPFLSRLHQNQVAWLVFHNMLLFGDPLATLFSLFSLWTFHFRVATIPCNPSQSTKPRPKWFQQSDTRFFYFIAS